MHAAFRCFVAPCRRCDQCHPRQIDTNDALRTFATVVCRLTSCSCPLCPRSSSQQQSTFTPRVVVDLSHCTSSLACNIFNNIIQTRLTCYETIRDHKLCGNEDDNNSDWCCGLIEQRSLLVRDTRAGRKLRPVSTIYLKVYRRACCVWQRAASITINIIVNLLPRYNRHRHAERLNGKPEWDGRRLPVQIYTK